MRLFTDFRYAEAARAVEGVEFVETKRVARRRARPSCSTARIAFEADALTYARWETLRDGGLELVPRRGLVEALRAVKDERELETIRARRAITEPGVRRSFAEERFVGRTERELAVAAGRSSSTSSARDGARLRDDRRRRPERRAAARAPERPHDRGRRDGRDRRRRDGRRLLLRLHAHVRDRRRCPTSSQAAYEASPRGASWPGSRRPRRA